MSSVLGSVESVHSPCSHACPILPLPDDGVPRFSRKLEAQIRRRARKRFGRKSTPEELAAYRQVLWAFAGAIKTIAIEHVKKNRTPNERESQPKRSGAGDE